METINMKHYELHPIETPIMNERIGGRPVHSNEVSAVIGDRINGLPVINDTVSLTSVWACDSWLWRLRFLFTGKLSVRILGQTHPAIAVSIGEIYSEVDIAPTDDDDLERDYETIRSAGLDPDTVIAEGLAFVEQCRRDAITDTRSDAKEGE